MSDMAIRIEGLGKKYNLQHLSGKGKDDLLVDSLKNFSKRLFSSTPKKEEFWALRDVSFEIKQGDRVGIIGRNGAGKSTLLKMLSRIVAPTTGRIEYEGRMASLLEVGTGFHGDLSGRENIYLNGSILGMRKKEIDARFDEIVAFSEVERFLDTPVKRYSSGMYVRLAFAVAAHLQSEILIVDEVLAVGDAAFQKKCLGKMDQISKEGGRTILFVSHNMQVVQKLCNVGVFLQNGKLIESASIDAVVNRYLQNNEENKAEFEIPKPTEVSFGYAYKCIIEDLKSNAIHEIPLGASWRIRVKFKLEKDTEHFIMGCGLVSSMDTAIRTSWSKAQDLKAGEYEMLFEHSDVMLKTGNYKVVIGLSSNQRAFQYCDNIVHISISDAGETAHNNRILNTQSGLILNPMPVELIKY
jgi:lipopolysaccharide transport system ATP-binding protein